MNERIKKLAEESTTTEKDGFQYFDKEKFAELIIMECVNICKDLEGEYNIDARSGRQDCVVEIKEHFGVEE